MCGELRFSSASGKRCAQSRPARRRATQRSPNASAHRKKRTLLGKLAHRTLSPSPFPAIGPFARTVRSPATDGEWCVSARFSNGRHGHERSGKNRNAHRFVEKYRDAVKTIDWERVSKDLDAQGSATIEGLLSPDECQ